MATQTKNAFKTNNIDQPKQILRTILNDTFSFIYFKSPVISHVTDLCLKLVKLSNNYFLFKNII